jgi:serine/threonine protein kinase
MTQQEFQQRYAYNPATDKLGEGGFGSVFKAYDNTLDKWVALKIAKVNPQYENIRLSKEVSMVKRLPAHPNIASYEECYTFVQMDGEYDFGILQYYEQGNLSRLLKKQALDIAQKQAVMERILKGIGFLHSQGIIHRDLKPQNILIVERETAQDVEYIPKITDFGISKQLDVNKSSIFSNSIAGAGTLAYASPEQLGDRTIRKNTDLWSFGVIAYQAFTGQLPFTTGEHTATSEAGRQELFRQINSGQIPDGINNIPQPWQEIIRRCLITDPSLRVSNAEKLLDILAEKEVLDIPAEKPDEESDGTKIDGYGGQISGKKVNPIVSWFLKMKDENHWFANLWLALATVYALFWEICYIVAIVIIVTEHELESGVYFITLGISLFAILLIWRRKRIGFWLLSYPIVFVFLVRLLAARDYEIFDLYFFIIHIVLIGILFLSFKIKKNGNCIWNKMTEFKFNENKANDIFLIIIITMSLLVVFLDLCGPYIQLSIAW